MLSAHRRYLAPGKDLYEYLDVCVVLGTCRLLKW